MTRRSHRTPKAWGELRAVIEAMAIEHGSIRSRDVAKAAGIPVAAASQVMWHHWRRGLLRRCGRGVYSPTSAAPKLNQRQQAERAARELLSKRAAITSRDISVALGISIPAASQELTRMCRRGRVCRVGFGRYARAA